MALPTETQFIEKVENQLGKKFPLWLTERLLKENGGKIEALDDSWELFSVLDNRDKKHLTRSATQIITETKTAKQWEGFPQEAIAIASNGTGDLLVLLPKDEQSLDDKVYLWEHDSDDEELQIVEINL